VQLVYSLSKSFTATAVGLLVDEGRLSLDDRVFDLLPPAELPPGADLHDRFRRLTVGHCLTMATGHDTDAWRPRAHEAALAPSADGTDPVLGAILAMVPEHEPGTAWAYNQVATYLVAQVVRAVSGGTVLDLLRERVLPAWDPDSARAASWQTTATGRVLGFSGLHVGTDAVLALAQTYLDRGRWLGRQLLSEHWVAAATRPTGLPNREPDPNPDWTHGYGCSFWGASHGYRGDGAFGQFAIVLPEQDIALAITEDTSDMQAVLDLVWEHLLPAVDREDAPGADDELATRMAQLQVPTPRSSGTGPEEVRWRRAPDSQLPEAYAAVRLARAPSPAGHPAHDLVLEAHDQEVLVRVGDGEWLESTATVAGRSLPVAAAGGWDGDGGFRAELRLVTTPHRVLLHGRPDGTVTLGWNELPLHGPDPAHLA
jgi:CubicO group peptidase (beta-lactamase class C family)